ncbi:MAG: hypothetical protein KAU07_03415 [Candidatus Andersenbacteria bacterium]|nr:hypothetical protein [Candidatus Andersenbacteria bacterium]
MIDNKYLIMIIIASRKDETVPSRGLHGIPTDGPHCAQTIPASKNTRTKTETN